MRFRGESPLRSCLRSQYASSRDGSQLLNSHSVHVAFCFYGDRLTVMKICRHILMMEIQGLKSESSGVYCERAKPEEDLVAMDVRRIKLLAISDIVLLSLNLFCSAGIGLFSRRLTTERRRLLFSRKLTKRGRRREPPLYLGSHFLLGILCRGLELVWHDFFPS